MALLNAAAVAPEFSVVNQDGVDIRLGDLHGKWVVLWWYPKADTPG